MTPTIKNAIVTLLGIVLLAASLALAFLSHYKHFYEFMVLGLFLILYVANQKLISDQVYLRLYVRFFVAGLIGDLILGITITKLWHYNYHSVLEYVPLYLVIYPVAGIVMLQTYVLVADKLFPKQPIAAATDAGAYLRAAYISAAISAGFGVIACITQNQIVLLLFFCATSIWALIAIAYVTRMQGQKTLWDIWKAQPLLLASAIVITTFINAFLHEIPNTYGHQWVYTNWPLMQVTIAGIPLFVLLTWPTLTLYPVSAYYSLSRRR